MNKADAFDPYGEPAATCPHKAMHKPLPERFAIKSGEVSVTKGRRDFGECTRCGAALDHHCQYSMCEACLRVVGIPGYPPKGATP